MFCHNSMKTSYGLGSQTGKRGTALILCHIQFLPEWKILGVAARALQFKTYPGYRCTLKDQESPFFPALPKEISAHCFPALPELLALLAISCTLDFG